MNSASYYSRRQSSNNRNCFNTFLRMIIPTALVTFIIIWTVFFFIVNNQTSLRGSNTEQKIQNKHNDLAREIAQIRSSKSNFKVALSSVDHLVIVPGHAVLRFDQSNQADWSDSSWYLLDYQKNQGFPRIISEHILSGIKVAKEDAHSLLVFSGGQTRKDVGPFSEAISYYFMAIQKKWIPGNDNSLEDRVYLEEYARDSFENLLFSICRFKEVTGSYPKHITVVGFDFKKRRFTNLHRRALLFPLSNFTYIGIKSESVTTSFNQNNAESGESKAVEEFQNDLYGCSEKALKEKRKKRDPFKRSVPYDIGCPELHILLHWCGPKLIDSSSVPWLADEAL